MTDKGSEVDRLPGQAPPASAPLSNDNGTQGLHGMSYHIVDDQEVIVIEVGQFLPGIAKTDGQRLRAFRAATGKSPLQLFPGWRGNEDEMSLTPPSLSDLPRSLDIDIKEYINALFQKDFHLRTTGAVKAAMHLGPLKKTAAVTYKDKGLRIDEKVVPAVLFTGPWFSGCVGYGKGNTGQLGQYSFENRGLPGSGGCGYDKKLPASQLSCPSSSER